MKGEEVKGGGGEGEEVQGEEGQKQGAQREEAQREEVLREGHLVGNEGWEKLCSGAECPGTAHADSVDSQGPT